MYFLVLSEENIGFGNQPFVVVCGVVAVKLNLPLE